MNLSVSLPVLLILLGVIVAIAVHFTVGVVLIGVGVFFVALRMIESTPRR